LFAIEHCILFAPNIGAEHQLWSFDSIGTS
jgi:hypothetical protein